MELIQLSVTDMSLDFSFHFSKIFHFVGFVLVSCVDFLMTNHNSYGIQYKRRVSVLIYHIKHGNKSYFFPVRLVLKNPKEILLPIYGLLILCFDIIDCVNYN